VYKRQVYDVGCLARPLRELTLAGSYQKRDGFSGELSGFRLNAAYDLKNTRIQAGIDYDDFTREDSRGDIATRYWTGASYQFNQLIAVTARMEWDVNYRDSASWQGFTAVTVTY
jgi:hypothetical protein